MRNVFGNNLTISLFGESHNPYVGIVIDGLGAGIKIDEEYINLCLARRKPQGKKETLRVEKDNYQIISGVFNHYTTGSSICILIPNENIKSQDYDELKDLPRPSHADYTANIKYHGYNDYRGGGHFSGRLTAPIVAAGAILLKALEKFNIQIAGHIKQIGKVVDRDFLHVEDDLRLIKNQNTPLLNPIHELIENEIEKARVNQDSVGGIIQIGICNLPVGLGEPFFSSLESELSRALFSLGGVKGIEFGLGFKFADKYGSQVNDEFELIDNKVYTKTNNNGGIIGGISNGMPVVFNLVIKPTPSIAKMQNTISMSKNSNEKLEIKGRHDPCIVRRIIPCAEALCAIVLSDMLISKYGEDVFLKQMLD